MNKKCRFKKLKKAFVGLLAGMMVLNYVPLTGYAANEESDSQDVIEQEIQSTEEIQTTEEAADDIQEVEQPEEVAPPVIEDTEGETTEVEETDGTAEQPTETVQEPETSTDEIQAAEDSEAMTDEETDEETQENTEIAEEEEEIQETEKVTVEEPVTESSAKKQSRAVAKAASTRASSASLGDVEMNVGETATHYSYPRLGFFCNNCGTLLTYATMYEYGDCYGGADDPSITSVVSNGYAGSNDEYLQTTLRGLKGGVTSFTIEASVHMVKSGSARCSKCGTTWRTDANKWVNDYSDSWTVTVYDTFELVYDANGGKGSGTVRERAAQEYYTFSNVPNPTRDGCKFLGWSTNPNATTADGNALTVGPSPNNNSKTVYAVWENKAPEAPKREDLYGIMRNFVNVHCVDTKVNHPDKQYSTVSGHNEVSIGEVVYSESEKEYTCTVTANGAEYAAFYGWEPSFGTGVKHVLAKNEEQYKNIVLRWDSTASKWTAKTATPITFNVICCQHNNIDYTDNGDGTHDGTCSDCKQTIVDNEEHTYVDGYCEKCGAEEPKNESNYKVISKNVNGEEIKSENRTGTVGDTVEVTDADKVIEGYTFDEANEGNILSATVLEDGSAELILYFIKDKENPDNPDKPDPEDPNKPVNPDPENPDKPDPEEPDTEDPNKPVNPDPENPDKPNPEDPNKPVNPDPENPDKPDPEDPGDTETPGDEEQPNRQPINPEVVVVIPEKPERTEITNTEITGTVTVINQESTETESKKSDDSTKADIPKTGEETNAAKPLAILVCALMLVAALIGKRRFFRS